MDAIPRRSVLRRLGALSAVFCLGLGCVPAGEGMTGSPSPRRRSDDAEDDMGPTHDLPAPLLGNQMTLVATLRSRRSVRSFSSVEVDLPELGQLMWSAQGITASWGGRTSPSAGALYPLSVYAAAERAVYRYVPEGHRVEIWQSEDVREALYDAGLRQEALAQAPTIIAIASRAEQTRTRYGERASRYVYLEAGHTAQNLLLQAVGMGLGAVVIGAFNDASVASALSLPDGEDPVYLIPVGYPIE